MAFAFRAAAAAILLSGTLVAGCAGDGSDGFLTTGAIGGTEQVAEAPKVDPACIALTSRIEGLRREGIADKIEKASAKKYKMTQADLSKADQLNKANAEFQQRCSQLSPKPTTAMTKTPQKSSVGTGSN
jgi:hypothetical protein